MSSSDSASAHWEKTVKEDYCTTEVVNGLVCFYSKNPKNNIYLCNLSTRETMKLPPPSPALPVSKHPCPYYLGFDDINKVYKLLQIQKVCSYFDKKDNSKILTLQYNQISQDQNQNQNQNQNQDCWRNICVTDSVGFSRSYCLRSSLYWIDYFYLICFDLNKESYSAIEYPIVPDHVGTPLPDFNAPEFPMWNHHWGRYYDSLEAGVTQVGGRLALTHSSIGATEFNIWLMDDNYRNQNREWLSRPKWDKITIHIPIHLRDPFPPSFLTIPAGNLPGTKKIVFTIGRSMLYKPLVGFHMPVHTYDLESETWETLDNNNLPADVAASSSVQPTYKEYTQIYYFHEDNILSLKDILAGTRMRHISKFSIPNKINPLGA